MECAKYVWGKEKNEKNKNNDGFFSFYVWIFDVDHHLSE